ncbi:MAG: ATP-binding protein [Armatimonadota bacterium]|nr:ATP-binding protein [Armatimonadota bacterium]
MEHATDLSRPAVSVQDDSGPDIPFRSDETQLAQLREAQGEFELPEELSTSDPWVMDCFTLPATRKHCREARARVDQLISLAGVSEKVRFDVSLAVGEAVANAIEHGSGNDPNGSFTVRCVATSKCVFVSVSDHGPGFNPKELPSANQALLRDRGRGIHCIMAVMDEVGFDFTSGTTVRMMKYC